MARIWQQLPAGSVAPAPQSVTGVSLPRRPLVSSSCGRILRQSKGLTIMDLDMFGKDGWQLFYSSGDCR